MDGWRERERERETARPDFIMRRKQRQECRKEGRREGGREGERMFTTKQQKTARDRDETKKNNHPFLTAALLHFTSSCFVCLFSFLPFSSNIKKALSTSKHLLFFFPHSLLHLYGTPFSSSGCNLFELSLINHLKTFPVIYQLSHSPLADLLSLTEPFSHFLGGLFLHTHTHTHTRHPLTYKHPCLSARLHRTVLKTLLFSLPSSLPLLQSQPIYISTMPNPLPPSLTFDSNTFSPTVPTPSSTHSSPPPYNANPT